MHDGAISAYYSFNESSFCNTSAFCYAFHHIILHQEYSTVYLKSHVIEIALVFNLYEELKAQELSS